MPIPQILKLEVTNRCNSECIFCSHRFMDPQKLMDMPFRLVKRLLNEASTWKRRPTIQLSGFGDPTLYPHLTASVKYCREKHMSCYFYTNGMLMTPSLTRKLVKAGLTWFLITIDARDKETYEKLRVGLKFETVSHNIKKAWKICRNSKTRMTLATVKCKENKHDIQNIKKHWSPFAHRYRVMGEIPLVEGRVKFHPANYCRRKAWTQLMVRSNGDVPFCCIDVENKHTTIGNVKNNKILEIFNSSEAIELRKRVRERKNLPLMCKRICFSH